MTDNNINDFIRNKIQKDLKDNKNNGLVVTRFPPEPNGFLHLGHAKSICLNFGLAKEYAPHKCHLRFDDTNPVKEDQKFVDSIMEDVKWLGFDWNENLFFASDYFEQMYEFALELINKDLAYVCSLSAEEIRQYRGTLTSPGKDSPFRNRSIEENLELFKKMKAGEFKDGTHLLRAKIDMSSPNLNMRDPAIYRIKHESHHRTGDTWCIYPMYDYAHCISDAIEGITHSLCTLEFEDHRPLYDWILDNISIEHHPQQIEFAKLKVTGLMFGKRKLRQIVEQNLVDGWDDPRMPTLSGIRRKGYTPEAIVEFCKRVGVAKADSTVDIGLLEFCLREDLNKRALRRMVVLDPVKLVITNYTEDKTEILTGENNPEDESSGTREISFSNTLYVEREDYLEDAPKKFFRLSEGREVRLKHAYYITCNKVIKDEKTGEIVEIQCTYDPDTKGGWSDDGRKVKGTIHWVDSKTAKAIKINMYSELMLEDKVLEDVELEEQINPNSLTVISAVAEESLLNDSMESKFQFIRKGYFVKDLKSSDEKQVYNYTVGLRDSYNK